MKIVLTGFMGTGKTSVGEELGRSLGYPFIDTDVLIEEQQGKPISIIFKEKGEEYFRKIERAVVEDVSRMSNVVIATGGGVIKDKRNVENLGRRGIIIWLKADPEIILKRVMLEGGKRPLLDIEEPLHEIRTLLGERERLYKQSDIVIVTDYITPGEAAHEIIERLGLDMQEVIVRLKERSYQIIIGRKAVQNIGLSLKEFRPSKVAVISNKTVFPLYRDMILESFDNCGIQPEIFLLPDGEEYKDPLWVSYLYSELLKASFDRGSLLVALGGGVVGDITGYVASTYMRGINYVQVPTTLLAQVDSSVGGKTGVNHPLGKNMIGTFHQPSLVIIDIDTLRTLPAREFNAGLSEIIKYGVIADERLFAYLENNREDILSAGEGLIKVIKRSCEIKADVVSEDEREAGLRAVLNFGHTIGHAIETATRYRRFLHGEAISIGMAYASDLAVRLGSLQDNESMRIKDLIRSYNLPVALPDDISVSAMMDAMKVDKKVKSGRLRFILPETIGKVRIEDDVDKEVIKEVLEAK
jgi:3-dehydroquinate synthase